MSNYNWAVRAIPMRLELSTMRAAATPAASGGLISQWRVGAIVEAVALRNPDDGQLWLTIGALRVPARIASGDPAGPVHGERLQLRVLRDSPVVALESVTADDQEAATVSEGLRRFLPRQSSSAPLFANLAWLTDKSNGALGKSITDAATRLWNALPNTEQLVTPEGLEKAVKDSGAFLENRLATAEPNELRLSIAQDLKALLSTLKQTLTRAGATAHHTEAPTSEPLPSLRGTLAPLERASASLANIDTVGRAINELAGQTEGALARLNTLQLVNAEASGPSPAWLLELPFIRNGNPETLRFRFERQNRDSRSGEQDWTVEAAMDLGVGGALHVRVSLQGARVGVQLRADSPALLAELQANKNKLIAVLEEAGLQVDRVQCMRGSPAEGRDLAESPRFAAPLLDIRV
jgi:hypothetical protein